MSKKNLQRVACLLMLLCLPLQTLVAAQYDPHKWEAQIEAFETEDKRSAPEQGAILFIGSSSIWFWHETLQQDMPGLTVIPRGFGGSTMLDALNYSDRIVYPYKPRAIVLYEGDNDISSFSVPLDTILERYQSFAKALQRKLPNTRLYILSVKPSIARWGDWPKVLKLNNMLRALAATDERLIYIDIATPMLDVSGKPLVDVFLKDELHMNQKGYKIWSSVVYPLLREREGQHEVGQ